MIDLYALTSPNVQKIYLMLEETKLPYKEHFVDVWKGDQFDPDFLKINPNGKIPVIVDHEGPGGKPYTVFESGAILMYLAEKSGKFLPADMAKQYEVMQWLMIQLTSVGPMFGQFTHFKLFSPRDKDTSYAMTRYQTEVKRLYEVLEQRLVGVPYLGGDEYTIADIATFPLDAQSRCPGREMGRQPQPRALVQRHQRTAGGEGRACQDRRHHLEPRHGIRRPKGPFFQSRPLCPGVIKDRVVG